MRIGYARVSTADQNPELQEDALQKAGCEKIFRDVASGAVDSRRGLAEAIDYARDGDTLVVWMLDRLGRSLKHLIETVNGLAAREIGFQSLRESIDTTTSGGKLIFHVFGALAEFERELRRRVHLGLNKGEARNSLARAVFFYRHGAVRDRLREDLQNKASGLNLIVAAIVLWNTVYLETGCCGARTAGNASARRLPSTPFAARLGTHQSHRRLPLGSASNYHVGAAAGAPAGQP